MHNHRQNLINKVDSLLNDSEYMLDLLNSLYLAPMREEDYIKLGDDIMYFMYDKLKLTTEGETDEESIRLMTAFEEKEQELLDNVLYHDLFMFTHYDRQTSIKKTAEEIVNDYRGRNRPLDYFDEPFDPLDILEYAKEHPTDKDNYETELFNLAEEAICKLAENKEVYNKNVKLLLPLEETVINHSP